jgi:hypothetical protein
MSAKRQRQLQRRRQKLANYIRGRWRLLLLRFLWETAPSVSSPM